MHWRFLLALSIALLPVSLQAQGLVAIAAGTRIRVTAPAIMLDSAKGTLVSVSADSLEFRRTPGVWTTIPLAAVTQLEVSRHRSYGLLGLGLGVVAGAIAGIIVSGPDDPGFSAYSLLFGVAGGIAGGIVGLMATTERWEPVTLVRSGARYPRAESREPRAESRDPRAESREPTAVSP
jgi:hypothetical protein